MQAILQKLSMNGFEWVENAPEFDEYIIRNYDQNSEVGYIFKVGVKHPKHLQ